MKCFNNWSDCSLIDYKPNEILVQQNHAIEAKFISTIIPKVTFLDKSEAPCVNAFIDRVFGFQLHTSRKEESGTAAGGRSMWNWTGSSADLKCVVIWYDLSLPNFRVNVTSRSDTAVHLEDKTRTCCAKYCRWRQGSSSTICCASHCSLSLKSIISQPAAVNHNNNHSY